MMGTGHLTPEQIDSYRHRTLSPGGLVPVLDHIAVCGACREAVAQSAVSPATVVPSAVPELHVDDETAIAWVDGLLPAAEKQAVAEHIAGCADCRDLIADMESARAKRPRRGLGFLLAMAAAIALLLYVSRPESPELVAWLQDGVGTVGVTSTGELAGYPAASAEERAWLREALQRRRLPQPASPLSVSGGVLRGSEAQGAAFAPAAPVAERVLPDRPRFSWHPLEGAAEYEVVVSTEDLRIAARSPRVRGTEWQPSEPLPRGIRLLWQITAHLGRERIVAPAPPAPAAVFEIASPDLAERIGRLRASGSHLLAAVLLARNGLSSEAASELERLRTLNPKSGIVEELAARRD